MGLFYSIFKAQVGLNFNLGGLQQTQISQSFWDARENGKFYHLFSFNIALDTEEFYILPSSLINRSICFDCFKVKYLTRII